MFQQQVNIINAVLIILDGICVIAGGYAAYYIKYHLSYGTWSMRNDIFVGSVLLVMFLSNYTMGKLDLYSDKRPSSYFMLFWNIFKAIVIDFSILATTIFLFKQIEYSRLFLVLFLALSFVFIATLRVFVYLYFNKSHKRGLNVRKILIVGDMDRGKLVSNVLSSQLSWGHEVIGSVTIKPQGKSSQASLGNIEELPRILRNFEIDEVIFTLDADRSVDLSTYLDICKKMGVPARILPALWEPGKHSLSLETCQNIPFLTIQVDNFNAAGLLYKRILDLVGGALGTFLLLTIWPFVAVAIKLDSPGPALFTQKRIGRHGRPFNLYKFRSMHQDAEQRKQDLLGNNVMNGAMFKMEDDPRVTHVGKWLRKTSLDEFPQFVNILKGEMSLVGTRPPTPDEVNTYQLWHLKRISMKPGITGLWQVSGRSKIKDFDKIVELDCQYLDNWRFSDDLMILFKTILVVLQRKGAV